MNIRRFRYVVAAFVAATGLAVGTLVVMVSTASPESANWNEQLNICATAQDELRETCFEQAFYAAHAADDFAAFNQDLEIVERNHPIASYDCHTGGHQAGRRAGENGGYEKALLAGMSTENLCGNGFIHGVFDELAHQKAPISTYKTMLGVCDKFPPEIRHNGCVDGYGHSAWLNKKNLEGAMDLCLLFSNVEDQSVCLAGIIMQMFRVDPFNGDQPVMSLDQAETTCERVRVKMVSEMLVETCYREAAWPLGVEAGNAAETMLKDRPADLMTWTPPAELLEKTKMLYSEAFDKCSSVGSWVDICREKIARSSIWRVAGDQELNKKICEVYPDSYRQLCESEARVRKQ